MRADRRRFWTCLPLMGAAIQGFSGLGDGRALAEADSDVAIDATVAVVFDEFGRFAAVREKWTFGYDYSAAARPGIDIDGNGSVDPGEVVNALNDALSWMGRVNYFTRISEGGQSVQEGHAEHLSVAFAAGRLVVEFTLPLAMPPRLAVQSIEVSDPDLFYEIHYGSPDLVSEGAPDYCSVARRSVTGGEIEVDVKCR
jgi:tRNA threonylcarbamoyladenosine biosynthesis protein TsaE